LCYIFGMARHRAGKSVIGIDVGGRGKGFHVVLLRDGGVADARHFPDAAEGYIVIPSGG